MNNCLNGKAVERVCFSLAKKVVPEGESVIDEFYSARCVLKLHILRLNIIWHFSDQKKGWEYFPKAGFPKAVYMKIGVTGLKNSCRWSSNIRRISHPVFKVTITNEGPNLLPRISSFLYKLQTAVFLRLDEEIKSNKYTCKWIIKVYWSII